MNTKMANLITKKQDQLNEICGEQVCGTKYFCPKAEQTTVNRKMNEEYSKPVLKKAAKWFLACQSFLKGKGKGAYT